MRGISIRDADDRDVLAVGLGRILEISGERSLRSRWIISGVEAAGEQAAEQLHRLSDEHTAVDGQTLVKLAKGVWQIINGKFEAFEGERKSPWLTVYAVDSSVYDVVTDDETLLARLRATFREVTDLPESAL